MKKILLVLIILIGLFRSPVYAVGVGDGDSDGNFVVDANDIKTTLGKYIKTISTLTDQYQDGKINIFDMMVSVKKLPISNGGFYVAITGNDSNAGTLASPFRTIQKCASVVTAGKTCWIRAGTYRELVTPTNSGTANAMIEFAPYNNEAVVISGADVVPANSWTLDTGAIYKAPVVWDLGAGSNQVFVDGNLMTEARWPNAVGTMSKTNFAQAETVTEIATNEFVFNDVAFSGQPDWTDGYVFFIGSGQWYGNWGRVLSSLAGQVRMQTVGISNDPPNNIHGATKFVPYFLFGKKIGLDSPGEWFLDSTAKQLYLWTNSGTNPSGSVVEVKKRQFAFDLKGKSFIKVSGIKLFATSVETNNVSSGIVLDNIKAAYASHFLTFPTTWNYPSGIILAGSNHKILNSEVFNTSGAGINVSGSGHQVINSIVHLANYSGSGQGAINVNGVTNVTIKNNTVFDSGRASLYGKTVASKVLNNEFFNSGILTRDLGTIYTSGDAQGTEIAYNLIHDNKTDSLGSGIYVDSGWAGNVSANYLFHHNVIWNNNWSSIFIKPNAGGEPTNYQVYNNTLWTSPRSVTTNGSEARVYNNLSDKSFEGTDRQNNLVTANPQFVGIPDFQLKSTSPAINAGRVIPGITDGFLGSAPDDGAYEFGAPAWSAGANFNPSL